VEKCGVIGRTPGGNQREEKPKCLHHSILLDAADGL
jgi:hypothetical protein